MFIDHMMTNSNSNDTLTKEMFNDPKTEFSIKFDNGDIFKYLMDFMTEIVDDNILYMKFSANTISFNHRLKNKEEFPPLDVCCVLRLYCLTETKYTSLNDAYILGVHLKDFKNMIKCKKNEYLMLERNPGINANGITTSSSPKDNSFLRQEKILNYTQFIEPKYQTSLQHPSIVVSGQEFCKLCQNFKSDSAAKKTVKKRRNNSNTININIYPSGLAFVDTKQNDKNEIVTAHYRYIGVVDKTIEPIACYTSKQNITTMIKLEKVCLGANIRIYVERDEQNNIKPIKMIYPIGSMGRITVYIGVTEYKEDNEEKD